MQALSSGEFNPKLPDAVLDLDGTLFKFTVLEKYVAWLCQQQIFNPLPPEVEEARLSWKSDENNEANYKRHTNMLVQFFIGQVAGRETTLLEQSAEIVARQNAYRRWDITRNIAKELIPTHNVLAISLMPDWLMPPFTRDIDFAARLGSTYVSQEGSFTGEAHSIEKAEVYSAFRQGDTSMLDIAMGDTMGDATIFRLARRPIAVNASHTLATSVVGDATLLNAHKDAVWAIRAEDGGNLRTQLFHCSDAAGVLDFAATRGD